MKVSGIIIFLTIVLSIYTLANWYIFTRTSPLFTGSLFKIIGSNIVFWVIVFAYPMGRILERVINSDFSIFFVKLGSFWLGAMLYLILIFIFIDIIRVLNHYLPFAGFLDYKTNPLVRLTTIKIVYSLATLIIIAAIINARNPRVNHYTLKTLKSSVEKKPLRIVAVSDIHLGTLISSNRLKSLVKMINSQNPDIVLFAGDVFDEDIASVVNNGLGKYFEQIKSPLGVFAITGNHEYFGGVEQKINYLTEHGVKVLIDSTSLVDNRFYLVGRNDRQSNYSTGRQRKKVSELVASIDRSKPIILLDHQPFNLNESAENGIDLQISGHTHHGQLWPFNYITTAIFELSSGYRLIGNTHFIVSNGYGTWGPPMRLGNRPEILVIDLE
ncbi:MAG: metallophosphoesterase [Bacteroidales bacterium]|nr:MAG: metallophosphoesterase [Bacteroidales bacterium]